MIYLHLYKVQLKLIFFIIQKNKTLKLKTQEQVKIYLKQSNTLLCGNLEKFDRYIALISKFLCCFAHVLKYNIFKYSTLK